MVKAQAQQTEQPVKTLSGMNSQLELYEDRVRIQRTEPLARLVQNVLNDTREVALADVAGVFLHESRYFYSRWISFVIQLRNHKRVVMLFDRDERQQAESLKEAIEANIAPPPSSQPAHT